MGKTTDSVDSYASQIFTYEHVDDVLESCDGIVAFGNHDIHVAERAAQLFLDNWGKFIVFSGGFGRITKSLWNKPEAEVFANAARAMGVPNEAIFVETESSNTGENIAFSKQLIEKEGLPSSKLIVVDRPYRGRRTKATLAMQWRGPCFVMASPEMNYQDYCEWYEGEGPITKTEFISLLIGDLQRIEVYGEKGFQEKQHIPRNVRDAYDYLVARGFTSQMIRQQC